MRDATGESTLEAKEAFERAAAERGVPIKGYHADNGRYAEHMFKDDCNDKMQRLTFCGVGAHHQNGIAEAKIKQLTLASLGQCCSMLSVCGLSISQPCCGPLH